MSRQDPGKFFLDDFGGGNLSEDQTNSRTARVSLTAQTRFLTQVTVSSATWYLATFLTAATTNSGARAAVTELRRNPHIVVTGSASLAPYLFVLGGMSTETQREYLQDRSPSTSNIVASSFIGAGTEAAIGNPFDIASLRQYLLATKVRHQLSQNPTLLERFSDTQLRQIITGSSTTSTREGLLEIARNSNFEAISSRAAHLRIISQVTGIRFTMQEFARMNGTIFLPSVFRNLPTYLITAGAIQSSASEGGELNLGSSFGIAATGAALTMIPNTAIYQTMTRMARGATPSSALQLSLFDVLQSVVNNPRRSGLLLAIRTAAIFSTSLLFTPQAEQGIEGMIDEICNRIARAMRIDPSTHQLTEEENWRKVIKEWRFLLEKFQVQKLKDQNQKNLTKNHKTRKVKVNRESMALLFLTKKVQPC
jgi:hypothetical protein